MAVDVRRAGDRFETRTGRLHSRHSFSFGSHYDPANTHFAVLVANNDHVVAPGSGFDPHPHRDVEVVTWVLDGVLVHEDSTGVRGRVHPGMAQRLSAGTGIRHSERNDSATEPVHFVQMWVRPHQPSLPPGYQQHEIEPARLGGGWVTVASGMPRDAGCAAVSIAQRGAALHATRLPPGEYVRLPAAPYVHLYVAAGSVDLAGVGRLDTGDAARIRAAEPSRVTAIAPAELLAWEMRSGG